MDNRIFKVNGRGLETLKETMQIIHHVIDAVGYIVDDKKGLVFFEYENEKMIPFPSKISLSQCAILAHAWLEREAKYPYEPDHDGDNKKGWLLYCDEWGIIDGYDYTSFIAVKPEWCMYKD